MEKQAVAQIDPLSRTATFRVNKWDDSRGVLIVLFLKTGRRMAQPRRYFEGVIRKDPVDKKEVVVAGFTGNKATAFPIPSCGKRSDREPDALFRVTRSTRRGGYGIHRSPVDLAVLNYLAKNLSLGLGVSGSDA